MIRYTYRRFSAWKTERKLADQHGDHFDETELQTMDTQQPHSSPPPKKKFPFKKFFILAAALVIPVFLETLDYTGMSPAGVWSLKLSYVSVTVVATAQPEIAVCPVPITALTVLCH